MNRLIVEFFDLASVLLHQFHIGRKRVCPSKEYALQRATGGLPKGPRQSVARALSLGNDVTVAAGGRHAASNFQPDAINSHLPVTASNELPPEALFEGFVLQVKYERPCYKRAPNFGTRGESHG